MSARKKKVSKERAKKVSRPLLRKKKEPTLSINKNTLKALGESQKRLSLALNSAHMGIWDWNIKTNSLWLSDTVHKIFGTSKRTFDGTMDYLRKLTHEEDQKMLSEEIRRAFETDKKYFVQHRIKKANGEIRWIEVVGKVFRNRKGKVLRMVGSVQDITEIKLSNQERKDWEARYKLIAASASQVVYDYNLKNGKIQWSGTIQEVLGYNQQEMNDVDSWEKLIHRDDRKKVMARLEIAMQGLRPFDMKYRFRTKSKSYIHVHDKGIFLANEEGQAYRMLGTMQDISEKIQIEEDLIESNRFKESMESAMPGMLYVYDLKNQVIVYVNHNITRALGYDWEEIEGMGNNFLHNLIHPDDLSRIPRWSNEPSRTVKSAEYRVRTKSDEWRWFYSRDTAFQRDQKGNVTQIIGIAQDITERKQTEAELVESEARFRTLQEASFGGIGLHDKGIIIDCNQGLSDLTGYSREELVGSDGLKLVAPEYRELVMHNILSDYEKPYDVEGVHKDGTRYSLEASGKKIPYKGRDIRVTEFRDITNRKLIEQKILEQNARLQAITIDLKRKNDQLEEFTQIVSHNLRSPIGNILSLLTFMETSTAEEDKAQLMNYLKESTSNALTTLEELNEVLKIKQNRNIEKQLLEFDKVFNQVRTMVSAKIAECSAEVKSDFSKAPTIVYPNIYLESIFLNLLTNALKYRKPDQKPLIELRTYRDKKDILLEVKDNGLGINLDRYGHQIFKLQKTFHKHPESRGIGLFMIKNQIEAMGGEISIKSKENIGTTFFINFNKHHTDDD